MRLGEQNSARKGMTRAEMKTARLERERAVECMWEDGYSDAEIARVLGATLNSVKSIRNEKRFVNREAA
jgi:DNA-binding NarL/FixJ family response regulator